MTLHQLRLVCAWLVRQAAYQEAREVLLAHQRRCLSARVVHQPRDAQGRWVFTHADELSRRLAALPDEVVPDEDWRETLMGL